MENSRTARGSCPSPRRSPRPVPPVGHRHEREDLVHWGRVVHTVVDVRDGRDVSHTALRTRRALRPRRPVLRHRWPPDPRPLQRYSVGAALRYLHTNQSHADPMLVVRALAAIAMPPPPDSRAAPPRGGATWHRFASPRAWTACDQSPPTGTARVFPRPGPPGAGDTPPEGTRMAMRVDAYTSGILSERARFVMSLSESELVYEGVSCWKGLTDHTAEAAGFVRPVPNGRPPRSRSPRTTRGPCPCHWHRALEAMVEGNSRRCPVRPGPGADRPSGFRDVG